MYGPHKLVIFFNNDDIGFKIHETKPNLPFRGNALHGSAHERVGGQHCVEMLHGEREHIAVRFRAHTGRSSRVCEQTDLAEVWSVGQGGGDLAVAGYNVHYTFLKKLLYLVTDFNFFSKYILLVQCGTVH